MGWFWFVPTFHMTPQSSSSEIETVHLKLTKKELDFPLGAGAWIVDVDVSLQWVHEVDNKEGPASRQRSEDQVVKCVVDEENGSADAVGVVSGLVGGGGVAKAAENVEAVQE